MTKYAQSNAKRLAYVMASKTEDKAQLERLAAPEALNYYPPQLAIDASDLYDYIRLLEGIIDDEEAIDRAIERQSKEDD